MTWQRHINELRACIAGLEADLAEIDEYICMFAARMPPGAILERAKRRHQGRQDDAVERAKNRLVQS